MALIFFFFFVASTQAGAGCEYFPQCRAFSSLLHLLNTKAPISRLFSPFIQSFFFFLFFPFARHPPVVRCPFDPYFPFGSSVLELILFLIFLFSSFKKGLNPFFFYLLSLCQFLFRAKVMQTRSGRAYLNHFFSPPPPLCSSRKLVHRDSPPRQATSLLVRGLAYPLFSFPCPRAYDLIIKTCTAFVSARLPPFPLSPCLASKKYIKISLRGPTNQPPPPSLSIIIPRLQ